MTCMRIAVAHNRYKYAGGEDTVRRAEIEMLRDAGHEVFLFEVDNSVIQNTADKIVAAASLFHSHRSSVQMADFLRKTRPDILHIHNWFPLLSPAVISVAKAAGVPVVQTLHNFRMLCCNALLYRDGKICHQCVGKSLPLSGALHGCYSQSRLGSALVTAAFSYHRFANTWDGVSKFIALTEFHRSMLAQGGIDPARIMVKPNFVKDSGMVGEGNGGYALFVGRLIPEKGIRTVLQAWEQHAVPIPLRIMGDGPLADEVRSRAARLKSVEYLGQRSPAEIYAALDGARFLIFSSECYDPFSLTIVEAYSRGTPVLGTDIESTADLVQPGRTGLRFIPGDARDLAAKAALLISGTEDYPSLRQRCRSFYEERYTDKINYRLLLDIYSRAFVSDRAPAKYPTSPILSGLGVTQRNVSEVEANFND
jgi:glycosyltransferase involved in cell wall biosynthesis